MKSFLFPYGFWCLLVSFYTHKKVPRIVDWNYIDSVPAAPKLFGTKTRFMENTFCMAGAGGQDVGRKWSSVPNSREALLVCLLLISCCAAQFLTGHHTGTCPQPWGLGTTALYIIWEGISILTVLSLMTH